MAGRVIGFIVMTFLIAVVFGFFIATTDFLNAHYDTVASGHRAAGKVYGLFGVVSDEIRTNDASASPRLETVARKIAAPYAVTADLSAILSEKLEITTASFIHSASSRMDRTPVRNP